MGSCFNLLSILGGVILAERDLYILHEILKPAAPHWQTLGGALGILQSDLQIIQHKPMLIPEGPLGYLREALNQWLKWAPPNHHWPTIEALALAVQSIGQESLAVNLKSLFLQKKGSESAISCTKCSFAFEYLQIYVAVTMATNYVPSLAPECNLTCLVFLIIINCRNAATTSWTGLQPTTVPANVPTAADATTAVRTNTHARTTATTIWVY